MQMSHYKTEYMNMEVVPCKNYSIHCSNNTRTLPLPNINA